MTLQVLVSDLGNVVIPFDFSPRAQFLRRRCGFDTNSAAGDDPVLALQTLHDRLSFGKGGCSSEEFYRQATDLLKLDVPYDIFCREYSACFWEDPAVAELIRRANVPRKLLLSNTDAIHWEWLLRHHTSLLSIFDLLLPSQELQALKPHAEIYRKVEALTGLPSAAHLLIDDLVENVEGARACGWDGIVHSDANALEIQLRARDLLS